MVNFQELSLPPVKLHCSVLAEDAIKAAVRDIAKKNEATAWFYESYYWVIKMIDWLFSNLFMYSLFHQNKSRYVSGSDQNSEIVVNLTFDLLQEFFTL